MAQKLQFDEFVVVYRNTWKNNHGNIRVQLYPTRIRAEDSAKNAKSHLFQEIATPIYTSKCLIPGG